MSQSDNWLYDTRDFLKAEGLISCLHGNNFFQDQQMTDVDMLELADELYDAHNDFREVLLEEGESEEVSDDDDIDGDADDDFDDDDGWDDVEDEEEEEEEDWSDDDENWDDEDEEDE